ncbi:MAG: sporulation protein YqfD [Christensenellales bacterium]|jgi:similar to stage IV sporulation protein
MADRVTLRIEGLMLEKLLERAFEAGAVCFDIRRLARREMELSCTYRSAKIVRGLADRYGMRCVTVRERGKSAYLRKLRARATAPVALLAFAALTALFLSRIWVVDVRVIDADAPSDAVYELLEMYGAVEGARAAGIDTELLAIQLTALEGYSYASVARTGVFLEIELAQERPAPELFDIGYERDLVAAYDAVIVSINVKAGTARVRAGDTVRRGQVLISGEERISQEGTQGVGALGSVVARMWCEGISSGARIETVKEYTGRASISSQVRLFDYAVPLLTGEEYAQRDVFLERLPVGGLFLPLVIEREVRREYREHETQADEDALKAALSAEAYEKAAAEMESRGIQAIEIIDKWVEFSMIDLGTLTARAVIELHAEIAVTRDQLEGR